KQPADRYQTMADFARALKSADIGTSRTASQPSSAATRPETVENRPSRRRAGPNRILTPLSIASTTLLLVLIGSLALQHRTSIAPAAGVESPSLILLSRPPNANVVVDGRSFKERTPCSIAVTAGAHRVRFESEGYAASERTVLVDAAVNSLVD